MQDEGVAIYIGPSRALASARTATKRRLLACGGKNRFVLGVRVPNKRSHYGKENETPRVDPRTCSRVKNAHSSKDAGS